MSETWVVRIPTWLGDTLMALPVLRAVVRETTEPPVFWGPPGRDELLELGGLDVPYLPYRRGPGLAGIGDALKITKELRRLDADVALLLPNAIEPALLTRAAGVPRRIGFPTDGRRFLLTDPVVEPGPRHAVHEADRFFRLAEYLGWKAAPEDHLLRPRPALQRRAEDLLPAGAEYIGFAAGSANTPAKRWPAESFAELASRAQARWGAIPILLGSDADREVNRRIARLIDANVIGAGADMIDAGTIDLSGCDLTDLAAAMLRCRAIVSNDSGGAHLAAALGRPTAVLFGPTDPRRTGPRGPHALHLTPRAFCPACAGGNCSLDHGDVSELQVADVIESLAPFWQGNA